MSSDIGHGRYQWRVFGFSPWPNLWSMAAPQRHTRIWQHHMLVSMAGFWLSDIFHRQHWLRYYFFSVWKFFHALNFKNRGRVHKNGEKHLIQIQSWPIHWLYSSLWESCQGDWKWCKLTVNSSLCILCIIKQNKKW